MCDDILRSAKFDAGSRTNLYHLFECEKVRTIVIYSQIAEDFGNVMNKGKDC